MFRIRLAPHSIAPATRTATPWKAGRVAVVALMGLGLVLGLLLGRLGIRTPGTEPDTGPVLVSIQKIGNLHTASFVMKDVLHQESQQEPDGWVSVIPGASNVVHWATHNEALVVAEGNVEAGIDLSQLSAKDVTPTKQLNGATRWHVHLPAIRIFPPNVQLHVENERPGLFWRDSNIVTKAETQARTRFAEAAEKSGIREKAQANAIAVLQRLQHALGRDNIDFSF